MNKTQQRSILMEKKINLFDRLTEIDKRYIEGKLTDEQYQERLQGIQKDLKSIDDKIQKLLNS